MVKTVRMAIPDIQVDSIVDGEGIRSVIWFQGCDHKCPYCQNPETWDFNGGIERNISDIKKEIEELEFQQGVTFSGGDPLYQLDAFIELAKCVHKCNMDVWVYTGFTYEQLMKLAEKDKKYIEALKEIDVLVDGPFVQRLKSFECKFRGSSNQRIIDVKKSLEKNEIILVEKYI